VKLAFDQVLSALERKHPRTFVFYGQGPLVQGIIAEACAVVSHKTVPSQGLSDHKDALGTPSLFGQQGAFLTVVPQDRSTAATLKLGRQWPTGFCLFITATSAPAGILTDPDVAAVPCYSCTDSQARTILTRHLQRAGMTACQFTPAAFQAMVSWTRLGAWQQVVDLVALFPDRPIDLPHLEALMPQEDDEVLDALVNPKLVGFWKLSSQDSIKTVRIWRKAFDQALQLAFLMDKSPLKEALGQIKPPIFFKNETAIARLAALKPRVRLAQALEKLAHLEAVVKSESEQSLFWMQDFLGWWAR
jgi:DNA polymerase III delta subunit